ncbi:MAG: hypothetical protein M3041_16975 [Acidobacteriota bacterium]|nr:hypothetical protein [Acidobacteriota bacterium]
MKKTGRELAVFAFFLVLAIVFTWPLAACLPTGTSDLGDPLLNTWILDWDLYAATHSPSHIYQAAIFHPGKYPLAYSENLLGIAIVALPFYLLGCSPLAIYNLMFILGFAFCGYGAFVLVRVVTGSSAAGIIAGVLYAFVPFRFDHMPHLQIIWGGWLPLMLAALLDYWKRSTWWVAAGFGAALLMNGLSNVHYFLFGTLTVAITIFVMAVVDRRIDVQFWVRLAVAGGLAVALMIPVLWPYKVVSELYKMKRESDEVMWGSANWTDWLTPTFASATYGDLIPSDKTHPERHLFPGLLVLFLTAAAIVMYDSSPAPLGDPLSREARRRLRAMDVAIVVLAVVSYWGAITPSRYVLRLWGIRILSVSSSDVPLTLLLLLIFIRLWMARPLAWRHGSSRLPIAFWIGVLWIAIGVLGSFGLNTFFHSMLYHRVQAFQSIRVPARWAMIAYVGLAVTSGFGAVALMRRRRATGFLILLAIAIFDMRPRVRWEQAIVDVDPVYRWLRNAPYRGAFLELPIDEGWTEALYLLGHTHHHRLTVNGTSGFEPPMHWRIRELILNKKWDAVMPAVASLGTSIIVVHDDWLRAQTKDVHEWLRRELAAGRLIFLRQFDHRIGSDFVFAIRANCADCARLRPPDRPDAAGFLPQQSLERALSGEATYVGRTFGVIDFPRDERVGKSLTVSGWALSPAGIREVDVLLHSGRVRVRAILTDRGDVQAKFPWYPKVQRAGYTITIPKRPRGVPKYSDVQVEIIDGSGARTRLPDRVIEW